jgi:hypothetical protein
MQLKLNFLKSVKEYNKLDSIKINDIRNNVNTFDS